MSSLVQLPNACAFRRSSWSEESELVDICDERIHSDNLPLSRRYRDGYHICVAVDMLYSIDVDIGFRLDGI